MKAYTIGLYETYDAMLENDKLVGKTSRKLGRFRDDGTVRTEDPKSASVEGEVPYTGGIVFRTAEEAESYLADPEFERRFDQVGSIYAVYEITLPLTWGECVDVTDPVHKPWGSGYLLRDALIVGRAS